ncbi:hypothetical protein BS78_06G037600 [Paspalum vaginatum]|nr:hypothetical protein BS78_06G037600 [Paspalum vaginatum]
MDGACPAGRSRARRSDGSRHLLFSLGDLKVGTTPAPRGCAHPMSASMPPADSGCASSRPRLVATADTAPVAVVIYFHGSGFVLFSAVSHPYGAFCRELGGAMAQPVHQDARSL